mgnify:FL=1
MSFGWGQDCEEGEVRFSIGDMETMGADVGDLVYLADERKWLGGLKSIHSVYGEPHKEDGVVYITQFDVESGLFDEKRKLIAEKEL